MGVPVGAIVGGVGALLAPFTGGATLPLALGGLSSMGGAGQSAPVSATRNSADYAPFIVSDSDSGLSGIAKLVDSLNTNSPYVSPLKAGVIQAQNSINWNYVILGAAVILGLYVWRR